MIVVAACRGMTGGAIAGVRVADGPAVGVMPGDVGIVGRAVTMLEVGHRAPVLLRIPGAELTAEGVLRKRLRRRLRAGNRLWPVNRSARGNWLHCRPSSFALFRSRSSCRH